MKKIIITFLSLLILIIIAIYGINKLNKQNNKDTKLTKVKVSEVAHSIFYAPQYLADSLGYFEDEGLDVEISLANGADAVIASVLSGDTDIGFCGPEATIYLAT